MMVWASLLQSVAATGEAALISVVRAFGSTPREAGARMIVTLDGMTGTIGGGTLEWQAVSDARQYLSEGNAPAGPVIRSQALGPDLGQCCGGRVEVVTEVFARRDDAMLQAMARREAQGRFAVTGRIVAPDFVEYFGEQRGKLYLFGAGHVGHALVTALAPLIETSLTASALPLDIVWVDNRPECLAGTCPDGVTARLMEDPAALVATIEPGSFVLIMTHSHALDYDLTAAALRHPDLGYIGLIGSATKRARFVRRFRDEGIAAGRVAALVCPIGLTAIRSKHPAAIAAAVTAQILMRAEEIAIAATPAKLQVATDIRVELLQRQPAMVTDACCGGASQGNVAAPSCAGCQAHAGNSTDKAIARVVTLKHAPLEQKRRDKAG